MCLKGRRDWNTKGFRVTIPISSFKTVATTPTLTSTHQAGAPPGQRIVLHLSDAVVTLYVEVHLGERESPRIGPFVVQGCQNGPSNLQVNCEDGGVSTGSKRFQIGPAWIAVDLLVVGTGPVARSSVGSKW